MKYLIRTKSTPHFYVEALHGVVFVTWVAECDKREAQPIPEGQIDEWVKLIKDATKCDVEKYKEYGDLVKDG